MITMRRPSLGFIGAGKVAGTLARLWADAGYTIATIHSRTAAHADQLATVVGAMSVSDPADVVQSADLVLLTVPDDEIMQIADVLSFADWRGKAVVHTSGAHDMTSLTPLEVRGAWIGSLHPAFPFADVESAKQSVRGAAFAIEMAHPNLQTWLDELVKAVGGVPLKITPGKKALYHAALVMCSNYTVTLYAAAERLLLESGADSGVAALTLSRLLTATTQNIIEQGVPAALTGPLTRSDAGTVEAHLTALEGESVSKAAYVALARLTYPLLTQRGVDQDFITQLEQLFEDHL